MTLLLSALAIAVQRPVFFWNGFESGLESNGTEWARGHLRPWPFSQAEADATVRLFSRRKGAPAELGGIRLTLRSRGGWLDVDSEGLAARNGRRGRFDVLGFCRFVRASSRRTQALGAPSLVVVRVANRSRAAVSVRSDNGLSGARVPAGGDARFLAWEAAVQNVASGGRSATVVFDSYEDRVDPGSPWLRVRPTKPPVPLVRRLARPYVPFDDAYEIVVTD